MRGWGIYHHGGHVSIESKRNGNHVQQFIQGAIHKFQSNLRGMETLLDVSLFKDDIRVSIESKRNGNGLLLSRCNS